VSQSLRLLLSQVLAINEFRLFSSLVLGLSISRVFA